MIGRSDVKASVREALIVSGILSRKATSACQDRRQISRPSGDMCTTTRMAAGKFSGSPATIVCSASTPPADAPIATTLQEDSKDVQPIRRVGDVTTNASSKKFRSVFAMHASGKLRQHYAAR
jgi:flavin reductase (DIM6/NTAB) family NADH-FMN oxidoreductase RutF